MMQPIELKNRMKQIVSVAYDILCNKIAVGNIVVHNEASLQMQFGVLLKQVGQLYEFSDDDRFSIALETPQDIEASVKSGNGKARCDIFLTLSNREISTSAAIELKCFNYNKNQDASTDNRFAVMQDIENLERYQANDSSLLCYEFVYTNNGNYANKNTTAGIKLAPQITQSQTNSKGQTINLRESYKAEWVNYGEHYFMEVCF